MSIRQLLDRWFKREEINGANRCPTYLYRWTLVYCRFFGVYLHHFVGDDWSLDMHDHPKRFISIGLRGQYDEETPRYMDKFGREATRQQIEEWRQRGVLEEYRVTKFTRYRAPWFRTFPATHIHRLRMIDGSECWTLVIVLWATRPWGFWHLGKWVHWREYVTAKGGAADQMKSCQ